ncbi:MAG: pyridoxamine 5'-phosphate oxidase family protein [Solobacterium sp.]|jgi:nitroimidazol reductase NimA-like FMN-containing flavoprotein (pyridoxamine 5'-phosphate oxidase superfamily)|nr:pyridoxamine 5'-phosphate oxidase family protein [Solobacterium sp.]MCH4050089.1 pyridoxamine 5'-phosphate oxidase family protein [Solobacterium sp.]MCH4073774.1 pyridoxamine 5'-phosphate oxidase family protein [Solobacterium sp.]MCI1314453.1 pyridoxamine 5'-phosphate oxidase family protein [Solobacterium sp.]MCI1346650.1 pyridoxamine 5'-phosphate oxidase family protein [Solobacterium sp.]
MRELRRKNQKLMMERCEAVLQEGKRGVLALCGTDGYGYAVPLNYWYDRDNRKIYFHGAAEGHKIDALKANPKCSFNVLSDAIREENKWWNQFDSVTAFGIIHIIEDREEKEKALYQIGKKYFPAQEDVDAHVRGSVDRVCILCLEIEETTGKHVNEK